MSFVVTAPPVLASAASDLGGIASMISEANAMAAVRTTALAPAAADEVSAAIAALFSSYARDYQTLSVQVTAFHVQFAQTLTNAGQLYAVVDVGNGVLLKTEQQVLGVIHPDVGGSSADRRWHPRGAGDRAERWGGRNLVGQRR